MDTLSGTDGQSSVSQETLRLVPRPGNVVISGGGRVSRRVPRSSGVHFIGLSNVGVSCKPGSKGVSGVPLDGEVGVVTDNDSLVLRSRSLRNLVFRVTRVLVGSDSIPLCSVGGGDLQVLGVTGSKDIETVAVIGGNDDQSVFELADFLQVLNGLSNSVIEFQQFTQSSVVVQDVEHLVDGRGFRHHEETLVLGVSCLQDVDSLDGHLGKARLVQSRSGVVDERRDSAVLQVLSVNISVEPPAMGKVSQRSIISEADWTYLAMLL